MSRTSLLNICLKYMSIVVRLALDTYTPGVNNLNLYLLCKNISIFNCLTIRKCIDDNRPDQDKGNSS